MTVPDYVRDLPTVVLFTVSIYLFLVLGFRFVGRRTLGQLTVIDLVIVIIMGSAVETAMVDGNVSLPAGLVCAATLFATNRLFSFLSTRSKKFARFLGGGPVVLAHNGLAVHRSLVRVGLTEDDLLSAIRERGVSDIANVRFAVMEEDGEINVVERHHNSLKRVSDPGISDGPAAHPPDDVVQGDNE